MCISVARRADHFENGYGNKLIIKKKWLNLDSKYNNLHIECFWIFFISDFSLFFGPWSAGDDPHASPVDCIYTSKMV